MDSLFLCFSCNNMLVGNNCREHHFPTCCKLSPSIRSLYRTMFARTSSHGCLNWIDCNTCDSQLLHRRLRGAEIEALTKWARMALRLFHRSVAKARLLLLRIRSLSDSEISLIVDFAAWHSDKRVQARPASTLFFFCNKLNLESHNLRHTTLKKFLFSKERRCSTVAYIAT